MLQQIPLSLYIHYPWCEKKCPYCDFNSHVKGEQHGYISALLNDLDNDLKYVQERNIESIFIGGGTPSLMSAYELDELFIGLRKRLNFKKNIEITLETNPGSFEVQKFKDFKSIGINRLSIGAQSFVDSNLLALGRVHNSYDAISAINEAIEVGFTNINVDLMYGLPNQSIESCLSDLKMIVKLAIEHISFYQLTIEPNTLFAKYPPKLPDDENIWQMGQSGAQFLADNNFNQYEVSAYAKTISQHNLNYWHFGDYIGIGAGAHGKITDMKKQIIFRTLKVKAPKDYLSFYQNKQILNDNKNYCNNKEITNIAFEFMLNSLRLKNGFKIELFTSRTGLTIDKIEPYLNKAIELKLLNINDNLIRPSNKGFNFLNDLQAIFL